MTPSISSLRPRGAALLAVGALACLAIAGAGCSSEGPSSGDPVAAMAPDRTSWNATYRSDATVLDAETVAATLKNPGATDGVYRFDASVGDVVATLPPGRALLLSGVDVVRVKSVTTEGAEIVVETEPATLPDVIQDGEASWDVGVDFAAPPASVAPSSVEAPSIETDGIRFLAAPAPAPVSRLSYSGPLGIFDVTGKFATTDDSLRFTGLVSFKSGNSILRVALDGTAKRFRHAGDVVIRNGKVEGFWFEVKDLDVVLDMNLGAVALGKGNESFALPIEIVVPQAIGPIPTFFGIGAKLEINPALSDTSSSRGKAHFVVKGSAGVQWTPAGGFQKLGSLEGSDVQFTDYEGVSTLDCGLGILAQYPIIKFGVGLATGGPAAASVYLAQKTEVVTNMTMRYEAAGPYPVITGNCFQANLNLGTYVGGSARIAGLSLSREMPVWTKVTPLVKEGKACP